MKLADGPRLARSSPAAGGARRFAHEARRRLFCMSVTLDHSREQQRDAPPGAAVLALLSRLPFAETLHQLVRHRPGVRDVDVSLLLMGSQARLDSTGFAEAFGTLRYGSMPMDRSPHVQLLQLATAASRPLCDQEIRSSTYWSFARHLADTWGDYFGASTDAELLAVTRNFIDWALYDAMRVTGASGSRLEVRVLVAKVPHSPTFQVIDGHHRVAKAIVRGQTSVEVERTWFASETALQGRLWRGGRDGRGVRSLLQPLPARELGDDWAVANNCTGRLVRMRRFLEEQLAGVAERSFLDVGAGYGWYVHEFDRLGWRAHGIEEDALSIEIAASFYDLSPGSIVVGSWTSALAAMTDRADVVSCLGLAERLGAGEDVTTILANLERVAGSVLFLDAPLDPAASDGALVTLVRSTTSLTEVTDLGANDDPVARRGGTRLLAFTR